MPRLASADERFQTYTIESGLPSDEVLAVRQTHDGYIWFTTPRGLVRFDGVHFTVFNVANTPVLLGTNFAAFSLMEDSRGALWAGSWNSGAVCYEQGHFRAYTTKDGLPTNQVIRIDEDEQHIIWIYGAGGRLSRIRAGKVEVVKSIDGEPAQKYGRAPSSIGPDAALWGLWRIGNHKIERFAYGKWSSLPLPPGVEAQTVKLDWTIEDAKRRLHYSILGRARQSFQVSDGKLEVFSRLPDGAFVNYQDRFGRLWTTDTSGNVSTAKNGESRRVRAISASSLFRVIEDESGGFWIGTRGGGLAHGVQPAITTIALPGSPDVNNVGSLTQDRVGNIWAASYGLTRLSSDGRLTRYLDTNTGTEWRTIQEIFSLWAEPDGTLICGYTPGVKLFKAGHFLKAPAPLNQIHTQVSAILRDREGTLWLGTGDGLYSLQQGRLTFFKFEKNGLRGQVRALFEDAHQTLWVATDNCVCRYRASKSTCIGPPEGAPPWRLLSITSDVDNVIWISSAERGLLRIEGEQYRWIGQAEGLPANDAAGVVEDAQGNFWIGSQLGIYRVNRQSLNDLAHGSRTRVEGTLFRKADGLEASNCKGNGQPHQLMAADGTIWFPTSAGLAHFNPRTVQFNPFPPRLAIESCSLEQKPLTCAGEAIVPPGGKNLEIRYAALSLLRPDQTQFKYRLVGFDPAWFYAGSRNVAYYSHLDPGTYSFEVTAANSDGVWNTVPRGLSIVVRPYFFQSLPFRLLLLCALAASMWGAWRLRTLQFQRRQARQRAFSRQMIASQETERKRIAGELHDALGQRLSSISNLALLADRSLNGNGSQEIRAIISEASLAASDVRQISRNLRPVELDLLGLRAALENLAKTICRSASLQLEIDIDDLSGVFPKELEIHLYRVVQECLHNVVKHAQATRVKVRLHRQSQAIALVVTDNGLGFSPTDRNGHAPGNGFGLIGISERSELLGGKAVVHSVVGEGTSVTIEILEPGLPQ